MTGIEPGVGGELGEVYGEAVERAVATLGAFVGDAVGAAHCPERLVHFFGVYAELCEKR